MGEAMAWGKRRYAERGIVNPSVAPYGYRTIRKGEWEVVEEEATIIRRIYRMLLKGKSIHEITKELSMEKVKGPGGNEQWHLQTIRNILRNEIYRGNYLYQKAYIKDTIEKKVVMNRGELPQYLIENHHKAIVDNVYFNAEDYEKDTFAFPKFANKLILEGRLGRKSSKGGLYKREKTEDGKSKILVYDIKTETYREQNKYDFTFTSKMNEFIKNGEYSSAIKELLTDCSAEAKLCCEALLKYIVYSLRCSLDFGGSIHAADAVMATGYNWCPPLAMMEAFETVNSFKQIVEERLSAEDLKRYDFDGIVSKVEPSKYDYRIYFKASK